MKILVTGSKGFIGKRLILALKKVKEYRVHGIDEEYFSNLDVWEEVLQKSLDSIDPDFVFHVGADANTLEKRVNYVMIRNYESTKIITNWCKENSVPIVYSSSAANYGVDGRFPSNLYGWSKYLAEDYVINNQGIGLRYFNVYGPGEGHKKNMASFLYQSFIKNRNGEKVFLFPGNPKRDFIHVDDIVSANMFAMKEYSKLQKTFYEVGTGTATSFEEVMKHMGFEYTYLKQESIPKGYQFYTCSNRTKWLPGWKPELAVIDGCIDYKKHLSKEGP